jgi:glycosyltransferase involved in cell wall biosynthesis
MIIGFDGSRAFMEDRTGTENYSYQLLKHLSKVDTENRYLIYLRAGSRVDKKDWPPNFQFSIINFQRLWTQVGLALRTFTDNLDILFVPAHTLPLIRKPGLKTVMTVHDLGAEYLPQMHQLKQRLYLNFMTHYQLKSATGLIAVSRATKEDLVKRVGVNHQKVAVIYEGINMEDFKEIETDILVNTLRQFNLVPRGYFLFVGTIQPRKNLERLVKAYSERFGEYEKAPKLVLAGKKGWLSEPIYELVDTLNLGSKVKFLGRVDNEDLNALYSGAIAFVFPSLFEGFGLPILEAFANNCPVITSNLSSMPEVAGEAALLVDPYDKNEIADGMAKFIIRNEATFKVNENERQKWIERGRKQLGKFSWKKCAEETLRVLESMTKGNY